MAGWMGGWMDGWRDERMAQLSTYVRTSALQVLSSWEAVPTCVSL